MVPRYFDENSSSRRMARQLETVGHSVYLVIDFLPEGADDELQLEAATKLGAVLITKDLGDFPAMYDRWRDRAAITPAL